MCNGFEMFLNDVLVYSLINSGIEKLQELKREAGRRARDENLMKRHTKEVKREPMSLDRLTCLNRARAIAKGYWFFLYF